MDRGPSKFWRNYRHRFVPWLAANMKKNGRREVVASLDKITSDDDLRQNVLKFLSNFDKILKSNSSIDAQKSMMEILGYAIKCCRSHLRGAGTGVIMSSGCAQRGDIIGLYPGTLYRRFEPLFLPSIGNSFILRCMDGVHIDGNDRWLSKVVYRSCVNRDSFGHYQAADTTWITKNPAVPWNIGQYVNNGTKEQPSNVAYQELDIQNSPAELDYLLPNIWYSGFRGRHLRTVALVATRDIEAGDEILSNYITIVHDSK